MMMSLIKEKKAELRICELRVGTYEKNMSRLNEKEMLDYKDLCDRIDTLDAEIVEMEERQRENSEHEDYLPV